MLIISCEIAATEIPPSEERVVGAEQHSARNHPTLCTEGDFCGG